MSAQPTNSIPTKQNVIHAQPAEDIGAPGGDNQVRWASHTTAAEIKNSAAIRTVVPSALHQNRSATSSINSSKPQLLTS